MYFMLDFFWCVLKYMFCLISFPWDTVALHGNSFILLRVDFQLCWLGPHLWSSAHSVQDCSSVLRILLTARRVGGLSSLAGGAKLFSDLCESRGPFRAAFPGTHSSFSRLCSHQYLARDLRRVLCSPLGFFPLRAAPSSLVLCPMGSSHTAVPET